MIENVGVKIPWATFCWKHENLFFTVYYLNKGMITHVTYQVFCNCSCAYDKWNQKVEQTNGGSRKQKNCTKIVSRMYSSSPMWSLHYGVKQSDNSIEDFVYGYSLPWELETISDSYCTSKTTFPVDERVVFKPVMFRKQSEGSKGNFWIRGHRADKQ